MPIINSPIIKTFFKKLGFILCKAKQILQGMKLQEIVQNNLSIQEICLERTDN